MKEVAPGIHHWTTYHERIETMVSSYFVEKAGVLVDPRVPEEGLAWFEGRAKAAHALLTNRHHYRHAGQFERASGTRVHGHAAGLHEFTHKEKVEPFEHGAEVVPGVIAREVGVLCPEETAFYFRELGVLAIGDALVRPRHLRGPLAFVPDAFMGDDPESVKRGLRESLARLLEPDLAWETLLLAHGEPYVGDGRSMLERFLGSRRGRKAA